MASAADSRDPPPYNGRVVLKQTGDKVCLVQIFEHVEDMEEENVVFRKECKKGSVRVRALGIEHPVADISTRAGVSPHKQKVKKRTSIERLKSVGVVQIKDCDKANIDVQGKREWVVMRVVSDLVIDIEDEKVIVNRELGGDSQKWWHEGGFIRNKANPGKVLAVAWNEADFDKRPEGKLAELHLVDEDRTAYNQRWIYNLDDKTLESGVPGRYVIDCWHASQQFAPRTPVIVYQALGKEKQQIMIDTDQSYGYSQEVEIVEVTFEIDTQKMNKTERPTNVCTVTEVNNSPLESEIQISNDRISTTRTTAEFHWENASAVHSSATFETKVPKLADGSIHLGACTALTVGRDSVKENTVEVSHAYSTPIKVPPFSKMNFVMSFTEGTINVPFTATLRRGHREWKENGTFTGVTHYGLNVRRDVEKIERKDHAQ